MKKITTLFALLIGFVSFAQSNFTVFNNGGQQFYVILNGIKQNSLPQTNVAVSGVANGSYSVKLIFSDGKTADIDKNFMIDTPSDITTRVVFKKGKGKLQLIGMEPTKGTIAQNSVTYRQDNSVNYSDAIVSQTIPVQTNTQSGNVQSGNGSVSIQQNGTTQTGNVGNQSSGSQTTQTVTQSSTTTVTDPNATNGNVGMNININVTDPTMNNGMGGVNMNVGVNGTGMGTGTQTSSQTTTTTVTTSGTQTSTNTMSNGNTINSGMNTNSNINSNTNSNTVNNTVTCKNILKDAETFVKGINEMTFDADKKELILLDLKTYCLTSDQAYKIIETLTYEGDRLEVAKYLFDRMIDSERAPTLMVLFTYDATKMEFREYIRKK